jgi:hypothetical protein
MWPAPDPISIIPVDAKSKCTNPHLKHPAGHSDDISSPALTSHPPSLRPSKLETNILHPTQPNPSHHFSLPALPIANVAPRATSRPSPRLLRHSFHQIKKSIFSLRSFQLLQPALSRRDHRIDLHTLHCKTRSFLQPQRPSILAKSVPSISFFTNPFVNTIHDHHDT